MAALRLLFLLAAYLAVALAGVPRAPTATSGGTAPFRGSLCAALGVDCGHEEEEAMAMAPRRARRQDEPGDSPALCDIFNDPPDPRCPPSGETMTGSDPDQPASASSHECSVFGTNCPSDDTKPKKEYDVCPCPDDADFGCECVRFYQCTAAGTSNQDGVGIFDLTYRDGTRRKNPCGDPKLVCCKVRNGTATDDDVPTGPSGLGARPEGLGPSALQEAPSDNRAPEDEMYKPCPCLDGASDGCECLLYYQCDNVTLEANQDGKYLVDVRATARGPCGHYSLQCCKVPGVQGGDSGGEAGLPPPPPPSQLPACGVRNRAGLGPAMTGLGDQSHFGEIPWMAAVLRKSDDGLQLTCGGGLIHPRLVLTAGHCAYKKNVSELVVRVGEWDSRTELELYKHQDRDVARMIMHPKYKDLAYHYDLALLVLAEPVVLGYHVGTVCLPEQGEKFVGQECLVSGWGKDKFGKDGVYANILRNIEGLPVVAHDDCQDRLRRAGNGRLGRYFVLNQSLLCAGGLKDRDACSGDGGGPLVCPTSDDDGASYKLVGAVAWGIGCGEEGVPHVYADVASQRQWIDGVMDQIDQMDP